MQIIDVHAHIFPSLKSKFNPQINQTKIKNYWGRMKSSTIDKKYLPELGEDVNFKIDNYGNYRWRKHGKDCWMKRMPAIVRDLKWPPEQMIACMDEIGVEKVILQCGYMDMDFEQNYFMDITKRWPERLIGTITIDYDIRKEKNYRHKELEKIKKFINNKNIRGIYQAFPRGSKIDEKELEPLWKELSDLNLPHFFHIGFQSKDRYLQSLNEIGNVLKEFPKLIGIINHLGGNIRPKWNINYTDGTELINIMKLPNLYFEVGYVLAYENWKYWQENYQYPYPLHKELIKNIYQEVGCERLLWGSDMPNLYRTCTYQQSLDLVRLHFDFLNEEEKGLVLGGNTKRIFCL